MLPLKTINITKPVPTSIDGASYHEATHFMLSRMMDMPMGAWYAAWDADAQTGTWYHSTDMTAMFRLPSERTEVFVDRDRARFRSMVFRIAAIGQYEDDESPSPLGSIYLLSDRKSTRRLVVCASSIPEYGIWLKAIVQMPEGE